MEKFSYDGYEYLLSKISSSGFQCIGFEAARNLNPIPPTERILLLRHDIDADMVKALEMAKIEFRLGLKSTYFLMLRSPIYNLLSRNNSKIVAQIIELGHEIGIHFDANYNDKNILTTELLAIEKSTIERLFCTKITAVSLHQPTTESIEALKDIELTNTYSKLHLDSFHYVSDSNMLPKKSIFKLLDDFNKKRIQLLIHPMWWMKEDDTLSTEQVWDNILINNFQQKQKQLLETERAYGTKRIFSINK